MRAAQLAQFLLAAATITCAAAATEYHRPRCALPHCKRTDRRCRACLECHRGHFASRGTCLPCSGDDLPNCARCAPCSRYYGAGACVAGRRCSHCAAGFVLHRGACVRDCRADSKCANCRRSGVCARCAPNFALDGQGRCQPDCLRGDRFCKACDQSTGACSVCFNGVAPDPATGRCVHDCRTRHPDDGCSACDEATGTCSACQDGWTYDPAANRCIFNDCHADPNCDPAGCAAGGTCSYCRSNHELTGSNFCFERAVMGISGPCQDANLFCPNTRDSCSARASCYQCTSGAYVRGQAASSAPGPSSCLGCRECWLNSDPRVPCTGPRICNSCAPGTFGWMGLCLPCNLAGCAECTASCVVRYDCGIPVQREAAPACDPRPGTEFLTNPPNGYCSFQGRNYGWRYPSRRCTRCTNGINPDLTRFGTCVG